jgi:hypothetical protein
MVREVGTARPDGVHSALSLSSENVTLTVP